MPQDKKTQKQPQKKVQNQKASGLVNANHYYETGAELGSRQKTEKQTQSGTESKQSRENPEGPG